MQDRLSKAQSSELKGRGRNGEKVGSLPRSLAWSRSSGRCPAAGQGSWLAWHVEPDVEGSRKTTCLKGSRFSERSQESTIRNYLAPMILVSPSSWLLMTELFKGSLERHGSVSWLGPVLDRLQGRPNRSLKVTWRAHSDLLQIRSTHPPF